MEVKGMVIGASKDAIHTILKAKEQGIYVVALDGNPNAEGLKYADQSFVVDISNVDAVCKVVEEIKPDFVIPIPIGRYLSTTGYVNEKFNFKGVKYNAALMSTDKYLFHKRLKEKGLRGIKLYLVNRKVSLDELKIEYPAIMKPRYGSGSRDVYYITNDEELERAYNSVVKKEEDFVLEQAIVGIEYSVDGAFVDGKLNITLLRKKIITPLPVRQPISSFSVTNSEKNHELLLRVYDKVQKVAEALEYDNCLLNVDLIINEEEVFVIEIAPRPSGHNLHNVFVPCATNIDIAEEYIKFLLGKECVFVNQDIKYIQIRFFDFNEVRITKVPKKDELINSDNCKLMLWNCKIKNGEVMNKVVNGHSIMGRGFFIVEGNSEEDLIRQSEWILSQFELENI